jgi:hypothetical protein
MPRGMMALMRLKRERVDVMIDAHVRMRRQACIYGEWPAEPGASFAADYFERDAYCRGPMNGASLRGGLGASDMHHDMCRRVTRNRRQ